MTAETFPTSEVTPAGGAPIETPSGEQPGSTTTEAAPAAAGPARGDVQLQVMVEALLFVSPGAVTAAQIAAAMECTVQEVEAVLDELDHSLAGRGLRLQRHRGRFQLVTAPETAAVVERFLGLESSSRLSRASMETLAIILYRQPVTRPQIDAIRGVNSDYVVKGLLQKGLIQEMGRAELPGRPILYSATAECLQYFGLASLSELPPLNLDEIAAA